MPDEMIDPQEQPVPPADGAETPPAAPETPVAPEAGSEPAPGEKAAGEAGAQPAAEALVESGAETEGQDQAAGTPAEAAGEGEGSEEQAGEGEGAEQAGPEYGVAVEDAGTLKKKIIVTVPEAMIEARRSEMFGELAHTAQVPGFRIGRAPRRLIEKRFGRDVSRDVRNALLGESIGKAIEKSGLNVLGEPDVDLDAIELPESGDMVYEMEVEVAPDFELPALEGIPVRRASSEVTEQRIDEAIERIRLSQARYETTDEPAAEQDVVVVAAKVSGEGIEPVETTGTLRVAPGQIEGLPLVELAGALAGKKVGETASMTVKVPEVHPNEDWRGKTVTVEMTLNEVRRRILPEIDDEYARQRGYDSLADYREDLAFQMAERMKYEAAREERRQVHEYLLANTDFDLPEGVANRHAVRVMRRRTVDLLQAGIPEEQVQEYMVRLQESITEEAQRELKLSFILQKIAEQEGITVEEEEINSRIARMAAFQGRRPERLRQELEADGSILELGRTIIEEKAVQMLLEKADIIAEGDEPAADEADAPGEAGSPPAEAASAGGSEADGEGEGQ